MKTTDTYPSGIDKDTRHDKEPSRHPGEGPLDKDAKVGIGDATSDPTGTSASHPGKPDPVSDFERQDDPSQETIKETVRQAAAGDTGSLSPVPATFAHLSDEGPGDPPDTKPSQPAAGVPSGEPGDHYQNRAKEAVTAMHEPQSGGKADADTKADGHHASQAPANRSSLRPWLTLALIAGLGAVLAACRR